MDIEIREEPIARLGEIGAIPISFEVREILEVRPSRDGSAAATLQPRKVPKYVKDYDALPGGDPREWAGRFDVSGWGLIAAWKGGRRVGAITVAHGTEGLEMLEGRSDLAVLWDVRVAPRFRGGGVGSALLAEAERWALARGCTMLKVETQNVNVPACRFYRRCGFDLGLTVVGAYPELLEEVQLLWYKALPGGAHG